MKESERIAVQRFLRGQHPAYFKTLPRAHRDMGKYADFIG